MLKWSRVKLVEASGVAEQTIINFERGRHKPQAAKNAALKRALEEAGITFLEANEDGPGIRMREEP